MADNKCYVKANTETAVYYQSKGSEPFVYQQKGKPVAMSYWKLIPEALEDDELLLQWFRLGAASAFGLELRECSQNHTRQVKP